MKDDAVKKIMSVMKNKRPYVEERGITGTDESTLYFKIVAQDDNVISMKMEGFRKRQN